MAIKKKIKELNRTEKQIRKEIRKLTNNELVSEYEKTVTGATAFVGSLKGGVNQISNWTGDKDLLVHYLAYATAAGTYHFTKKCIQEGKIKELRVKIDARHHANVSVGEIFADAVRRLAILEEYVRRKLYLK